MHNLLILGTGRSGTSMVAALFRKSHAYLGDNLLAGRVGNPFGYYEDPAINQLNAHLIGQIVARLWTTRLLPWGVHPVHRRPAASWLAAPWYLPPIQLDVHTRASMRAKLTHQPFCLKDPRFCVTLPTWRPFLPADTRYIVVFRDPRRTVDSMLRDAHEREDDPLPVDARWATVLWWRTYRRLLRDLSRTGEWLFVHYDDVLNGAALPAISEFAAVAVDAHQLDPSVSRAQSNELRVGSRWVRRCASLYEDLRVRAAADLVRWSPAAPESTVIPPPRNRATRACHPCPSCADSGR